MSITITTTMTTAAADMTIIMSRKSTSIIITTTMTIAAAGMTTIMSRKSMSIITIMTTMTIAAAGMTIIMSTKNRRNRCSAPQQPAARQKFTAWKIWTARTAAQRLKAASMPWMACRMPC